MKFSKTLRTLLDEIFPDWQDQFISYKDLKKELKLIHPVNDGDERSDKRRRLGIDQADGGDERTEVSQVTEKMNDFVKLLDGEIKKFNKFFMDKEEDYIIRLKMLKDDIAEARNSEKELMEVGRKMVDFHGEMILLENYSALNYIGLVKILKKYDKRSGDLIRMPFIQKVLQEPFFRTDVINKLVKECETMISSIFARQEQLAPLQDTNQEEGCSELLPLGVEETKKAIKVPEGLAEIECMKNKYMKLSISALGALKQIRSGSSTQSVFSLPPMDGKDDLSEPEK